MRQIALSISRGQLLFLDFGKFCCGRKWQEGLEKKPLVYSWHVLSFCASQAAAGEQGLPRTSRELATAPAGGFGRKLGAAMWLEMGFQETWVMILILLCSLRR